MEGKFNAIIQAYGGTRRTRGAEDTPKFRSSLTLLRNIVTVTGN
jgi:hypothetical protein